MPASTSASEPTPIATIDSPRAMITISPWRSAKWPGRAASPRRRRSSGPAVVEQQRERPERALQQPVGKRGADQQPDADRGADRQRRSRSGAAPGRRGWRSRTARCARRARPRRRPRTAAPTSSNASGTHSARHQERRHRAEHRDPDDALLGVDQARQPGVAAPRPPQDARARASPSRGPARSASFAISAVHCVSASTNTRSKKSSSGVTRSSSRMTRRAAGRGGAWRCSPPHRFKPGKRARRRWRRRPRPAPRPQRRRRARARRGRRRRSAARGGRRSASGRCARRARRGRSRPSGRR